MFVNPTSEKGNKRNEPYTEVMLINEAADAGGYPDAYDRMRQEWEKCYVLHMGDEWLTRRLHVVDVVDM